jgi:hypothetical protein
MTAHRRNDTTVRTTPPPLAAAHSPSARPSRHPSPIPLQNP